MNCNFKWQFVILVSYFFDCFCSNHKYQLFGNNINNCFIQRFDVIIVGKLASIFTSNWQGVRIVLIFNQGKFIKGYYWQLFELDLVCNLLSSSLICRRHWTTIQWQFFFISIQKHKIGYIIPTKKLAHGKINHKNAKQSIHIVLFSSKTAISLQTVLSSEKPWNIWNYILIQIEIPYDLMVLLPIPLNKLQTFVSRGDKRP